MASVVFWVTGVPRSLNATLKDKYVEAIRAAAKAVITAPLKTPRLDIEIVFACRDRNLRADVDNTAKPVLDALIGVAYADDKQVRSVRVVALPLDDAFKTSGAMDEATWSRLLECKEFAVIVRSGNAVPLEFPQTDEPSTPSS